MLKTLLSTAVLSCLLAQGAFAQAPSVGLKSCINEDDRLSEQEAIEACTKVIDQRSERGNNLAMAHYFRGKSYERQDEDDNAIADYTKAIGLNPRYFEAFRARGSLYESLRQYDKAIADQNQAITINPRSAGAYNDRGVAYEGRGDIDLAIADYDRSLKIDPDDVGVLANRGDAYRKKGDFTRAFADLDKALEMKPDHANNRRMRGDAFRDQGNFAAAVPDYARAVELQPKSGAYRAKLAYGRFYKGDFAIAAAEFTKSLEIRRNVYQVLFKHVALARAGTPSMEDLNAEIGGDDKDWPYPVMQFLHGDIDATALLAAAKNADQTCEANFYIGQKLIIERNESAAKPYLTRSAQTCKATFMELYGARADLARMR